MIRARAHLGAFLTLVLSLSFTGAGIGCRDSSTGHSHANAAHTEHGEEYERGPHGGRMLRQGSFAIEIQIFEKGVPPQLRAFGYHGGQPLEPSQFTTKVRLERLGGRIDDFVLGPMDDFLTSSTEVFEPHSFDVVVEAEHNGSKYSWSYPSYEGRVVLSPEVAQHSGITTERVEPHVIRAIRRSRGKIVPSEHRIAHVIPRFAGVVREGRKHIGDRVEKGEVLAIIESNQSLQPFEVRSQISGTVVNGHLIVGEYVPENQWVYIVADISEVWADLFVPLRERLDIVKGQRVIISSVTGTSAKEGLVSYVAPYADERAQAQLVRVVIPNEDSVFVPGMFISGEIVVNEDTASVTVRRAAIQRLREWDVVFVRVGDVYEARPIKLGRSDSERTEILQGLSVGEEYVVGNSFLIKADILKTGASHDH